MRRFLSGLFGAIGALTFFVTGLWSFFLSTGIISDEFGFWGLVLGWTIFPVMLSVAPLYAGFELGNWFPAIITYGGTAFGMTCIGLAMLIDSD